MLGTEKVTKISMSSREHPNGFKAWAMLGPRDPYALAAFESRWKSRSEVVVRDGVPKSVVGVIKPQCKTPFQGWIWRRFLFEPYSWFQPNLPIWRLNIVPVPRCTERAEEMPKTHARLMELQDWHVDVKVRERERWDAGTGEDSSAMLCRFVTFLSVLALVWTCILLVKTMPTQEHIVWFLGLDTVLSYHFEDCSLFEKPCLSAMNLFCQISIMKCPSFLRINYPPPALRQTSSILVVQRWFNSSCYVQSAKCIDNCKYLCNGNVYMRLWYITRNSHHHELSPWLYPSAVHAMTRASWPCVFSLRACVSSRTTPSPSPGSRRSKVVWEPREKMKRPGNRPIKWSCKEIYCWGNSWRWKRTSWKLALSFSMVFGPHCILIVGGAQEFCRGGGSRWFYI